MPALPPQIQTALIKRLNALIQKFCPELAKSPQRGTSCFTMNPDVVFSTAQQSEAEDKANRMGFERGVRDAMIRMMVDVMGDYRRHLVAPQARPAFSSASSELSLAEIFNAAAFRAGAPKANQMFLAKFVTTQAFTKFCDERTFVSDTSRVDAYSDLGAKFILFDAIVDAAVDANDTLANIGRSPTLLSPPSVRSISSTTSNESTSMASVASRSSANGLPLRKGSHGMLLRHLSGASWSTSQSGGGSEGQGSHNGISRTGSLRGLSRRGTSYALTDRSKRMKEKNQRSLQRALVKQNSQGCVVKTNSLSDSQECQDDSDSGSDNSSSSSSSGGNSPVNDHTSSSNAGTKDAVGTTTANTATSSARQDRPRASLTGANWTMFNHYAQLMLPLKVRVVVVVFVCSFP
jgi:hypothetical protein